MPVAGQVVIPSTPKVTLAAPLPVVAFEAGDQLEGEDVLMVGMAPGPNGPLHNSTQVALVEYHILLKEVSC